MKHILWIAVVALLVSCSSKKEPLNAELQFVLGNVTINGQRADLKTPVNDGDVVETGGQSLARIKIGEKTVIQIKANSRLVYKLESENTLQLDAGWMAGITRGKLLKGEYKIKTPTAVAAVRGTAYCIKVESPESTYFCTCNGTIHQHAVGQEDHGEDVTASHHNARRYIKDGNSYISEEAAMEYHADKDIEEIAAIIDETVDWGNSY